MKRRAFFSTIAVAVGGGAASIVKAAPSVDLRSVRHLTTRTFSAEEIAQFRKDWEKGYSGSLRVGILTIGEVRALEELDPNV